MKSGDPLILLAIVIIGAIVIAFPLAVIINRIIRWYRFRKIIAAIEATGDGFDLRSLPSHKANVMALARKQTKDAA